MAEERLLHQNFQEGGPGSGRFPRDPSKPTSRYYIGPKGGAEPSMLEPDEESEFEGRFSSIPPGEKIKISREIFSAEERQKALREINEALELIPEEDFAEVSKIRIVSSDELSDRLYKLGVDESFIPHADGIYNADTGEIFVRTTEGLKDVVLHELGHAVYTAVLNSKQKPQEREEFFKTWRQIQTLQLKAPLFIFSTTIPEFFADAYSLYHQELKSKTDIDETTDVGRFQAAVKRWFDDYYERMYQQTMKRVKAKIRRESLSEGGPGSGRFPRDPSKPTSRYYVGPKGRRPRSTAVPAPAASEPSASPQPQPSGGETQSQPQQKPFSYRGRFGDVPRFVKFRVQKEVLDNPEMKSVADDMVQMAELVPEEDFGEVSEVQILTPDELYRQAVAHFGAYNAMWVGGFYEGATGRIVVAPHPNASRQLNRTVILHEVGHAFGRLLALSVEGEKKVSYIMELDKLWNLNQRKPLSVQAMRSFKEFVAEAYAFYHLYFKHQTVFEDELALGIRRFFDRYYQERSQQKEELETDLPPIDFFQPESGRPLSEGGPGSGRFPRDPSKPTSRYYIGPKGVRRRAAVKPTSDNPADYTELRDEWKIGSVPIDNHDRFVDTMRMVSQTIEPLAREAFKGKRPLTAKERVALESWSGASFIDINGYLRFGEAYAEKLRKFYPSEAQQMLQNIRAKIRRIDSAIAAHETQQDVVLWRSYSVEAAGGSFEEGEVFKDKGFISTTLIKEVVDYGSVSPSRFIAKILVPKGTKAIFLGNELGLAAECEVLLGRGNVFRVLEVRPSEKFVLLKLLPRAEARAALAAEKRKAKKATESLREGGPGSGRFPRDPSKPTSRYYIGPKGLRRHRELAAIEASNSMRQKLKQKIESQVIELLSGGICSPRLERLVWKDSEGNRHEVKVVAKRHYSQVVGRFRNEPTLADLAAEEIASDIGKVLGFENVAEAAVDWEKIQVGDFQNAKVYVPFIDADRDSYPSRILAMKFFDFRESLKLQDARQICVLDVLLANPDRHAGNVIFDGERGRVWAIDHSRAWWRMTEIETQSGIRPIEFELNDKERTALVRFLRLAPALIEKVDKVAENIRILSNNQPLETDEARRLQIGIRYSVWAAFLMLEKNKVSHRIAYDTVFQNETAISLARQGFLPDISKYVGRFRWRLIHGRVLKGELKL